MIIKSRRNTIVNTIRKNVVLSETRLFYAIKDA